ncbi:MAG: bifunctional hydroxymethylpyrimidine kinase/phosphomethylpyrimidine kinase [Alsobacter sp.]
MSSSPQTSGTAQPAATPIAVTIAGSDSGGGAGIQADLKTFSALGVYGATVLTALTAQNTLGVQAIHDIPVTFIREQMASVFGDLKVTAVKIGMLSQARIIETVAGGLDQAGVAAIVLDPVMVATSGDRLLSVDAVDALRDILMPRALVVTPNMHEAAVLTGLPLAESEADMRRQGEMLLERGARAVLVKGGHGDGRESVDVLVEPEGMTRFPGPRVATRNTHGTGCTLSAAIAAGLATGLPLQPAVKQAKDYLGKALAAADRLSIGSGSGPVHHFHRWWQDDRKIIKSY